MKLFGRKWAVEIGRKTFDDFDMSFSIVKTSKPEPNTCELRLYNLGANDRGELASTPLVKIPEKTGPAKHQHKGIPVRIEAGYKDADCVIWQGDLRTVESKHEGPDWVTELGSGDGEEAYQRSRVNLSFGPGTDIATVLVALAGAIGLGLGNLQFYLPEVALRSPIAAQIAARGFVLSGSAAEQLTSITRSIGLEWSIQDGVVQFTSSKMPTRGQAVLVSPLTGMVGEPSIDNEGVVTVKMLMIPNVTPGTAIVIGSESVKGNYRIEKATYEGDTSGQPWYITCECRPWGMG